MPAPSRPSNLDLILFAVAQAREAEAFGFTRNECNRNLKTALHQYWQNKTLGMHGQARKAALPRSAAAVGVDTRDCITEHAVPQQVIVNLLMDHPALDLHELEDILRRLFRVCLVTREEDDRLRQAGLRSQMPDDWDEVDVWARYRVVGIEPPVWPTVAF